MADILDVGELEDVLGNMDDFKVSSSQYVKSGVVLANTFTSLDILYTILFSVFAIAVVAPPTEVVSAGLTVENIFGNILGSEQLHFVYYHIKRTSLVRVVHSFLPLVYYIYMCWISDSLHFLHYSNFYGCWEIWSIISFVLPVVLVSQVIYWYKRNWSGHPIVHRLAVLAANNNIAVSGASDSRASAATSWRAAATAINIEFRRMDKFVTGSVPSHKVAVTDNWIIVASTYDLKVAHQSDALLTVEKCEDHSLSPEGGLGGTQILNIAVDSITQRKPYFKIRLNAGDYQNVKDKLSAPMREAQGVVIRQSLSEQFIAAFRTQVEENALFQLPPEMEVEQCIGCMLKLADVKLTKRCANDSEGDCRSCFCRPMWCLSCMARWFASRQMHEGRDPSTWMSQKVPCPTCRSLFCILDVNILHSS